MNNRSDNALHTVGWVGTVMVLLSIAGASFGFLTSEMVGFHIVAAIGTGCTSIFCFWKKNHQVLLIQIAAFIMALCGIYRLTR